MSQMHTGKTNKLLGYPDNARLLLVNADDFGMYPDVNAAIVRLFKEGIVRSTSLMIASPEASQAIQLLEENPDIRFGIHLTVVADYDYRWEPLTPREKVPSLLDERGYFYNIDRQSEMLERAKRDELEVEFRTQIEAALAAGLTPTHIDWHSLLNGGRSDIFDLTLGLAKEYGLALRVMTQPYIDQVQGHGLPANDYNMLDFYRMSIEGRSARCAQLLRELPVGLTEWAVHPSLGSAESQAIDPDGWQIRRADFDFLISPQAREIIHEEGITLLSYEPLQKIWQRTSS
jgi:predicted glycoside hydrolase/deacetylase ChbG (UPF0249 family)